MVSHTTHLSSLIVNHENNTPVLDSCFSPDGSTVFTVGADKAVRMWQLGQTPPNNTPQQIGAHDQPIKSVGFLSSTNLIVSGGWDNLLKFWDARQPNPVGTLALPERCYDLDVQDGLMVVATAGRHIISYNVQGQPVEHERKESPLKFQSRCIAAFPDATGYAVGSIEGRVGIHYVTKVHGKESFAFKCHRVENNVYPVNCIAFHRGYGTFATVGADGIVNFWDKDNKQRLKGFPAIQRTISCANFNATGNLFAYSSSYDWSMGCSQYAPGTPNELWIHYVLDDEIKPKGKKSSYGR
jgi:mRNA export factor